MFGRTSSRTLVGEVRTTKTVEVEVVEKVPFEIWIESENGDDICEQPWLGIDIVVKVGEEKFYLATISKDGLEILNLERQYVTIKSSTSSKPLSELPFAIDNGHIKTYFQDKE